MLSQVPNSQALLNVQTNAVTNSGNQHYELNLAEGQFGLNPLHNRQLSATAPITDHVSMQPEAQLNGGETRWQQNSLRLPTTVGPSGPIFSGTEGPLQFGNPSTSNADAHWTGPPQGEVGPLHTYPLQIIGSPIDAAQTASPTPILAPTFHPGTFRLTQPQPLNPSHQAGTEKDTLPNKRRVHFASPNSRSPTGGSQGTTSTSGMAHS
ncbi:hypothetical protein R1flu_008113 [Riccia fluitans]|uniref:Uncharacterized protein n=1 Tax=Riccia fluitans TaxID=41844 RepID=A0ABD1YAY9_9MARC